MISFRLIIVLIVLSGIGSQVYCKGRSLSEAWGSNLKKEMKEIDSKLEEDVDSKHTEDQFAYVQKLLNKYESGSSCVFKSTDKKKRRIEAAKLVLSIRELAKPEMCNRVGSDIAFQVGGALNQNPICIRVGRIYYEYMLLQEKVCKFILPKRLREKLATMDKKKLMLLDEVTESEMIRGVGYSEVERLFRKVKEDNVGPTELNMKDAFKNISAEKDANPNDLLYGVQRQSLEKYLLEPCRYIVEELGPDYFELAGHWLMIHKFINNPNYDEVEFYRYWVKYELCQNALAYSAAHPPK